VNLVKQQAALVKHDIPYAILLTRTNALIQTRNLRAIREQLRTAGINILAVELTEREAFKTLFSTGGTLSQLKAEAVGGLEGALKNSRSYAQEVLTMLTPAHAKVDEGHPEIRPSTP